MKLIKLKRPSIFIISISLIAILLFQPIHTNAKIVNDTSKNMTTEEISDILDNYLLAQSLKLEKGTPEYVEYLTDLLTFENDENLKQLPEYESIKIYASNYIINYNAPLVDATNNPQNSEKNCKITPIPKTIQNKTIKQLEYESHLKETQIENDIQKYKASHQTIVTPKAAYSPSSAASYAIKYANSVNSAYGEFSGKDCTNFVSQAVEAGKKPQKIPSDISSRGAVYSTTNYWYNRLFDHGAGISYGKMRKYSTAWTVVSDFYSYWSKNGASTTTYTSLSSLQKNLKLGDIIQLNNGSNWYHSIIVTGGSSGKWLYCGHSYNRNNYPVSKLSASKYRIIRIK